jgi:HPt (histidine-containing phosphotransfer) domain-containing protein
LDVSIKDETLGEYLINKFIDRSGKIAGLLKREAHSMKGASANIGAGKLRNIYGNLEKLGVSGDLEPSDQLLTRLQSEFKRVSEFLNSAPG